MRSPRPFEILERSCGYYLFARRTRHPYSSGPCSSTSVAAMSGSPRRSSTTSIDGFARPWGASPHGWRASPSGSATSTVLALASRSAAVFISRWRVACWRSRRSTPTSMSPSIAPRNVRRVRPPGPSPSSTPPDAYGDSAMSRLNNQLRTVVLLGALTALLVGVGGAVAPGHLSLVVVLAIAVNVGAYFFSDRLVLRMAGAREVAPDELPELHAAVCELALRAGIPTPRLYLIDDPQPNAFATGRNPAHGVVAVTRGILALLPPRELRGVLAHELAHIRNRDILVSTVAACIAGAIGYAAHAVGFLGLGARGGDEDGDHGGLLGGLALMIVTPIVATLIQLGISRSREYLADETGARLCGDPLALARALDRLDHAA